MCIYCAYIEWVHIFSVHFCVCVYTFIYIERERQRQRGRHTHGVNNREIGGSNSHGSESNDVCCAGFIPRQKGERENYGNFPQSAGNGSPDQFSTEDKKQPKWPVVDAYLSAQLFRSLLSYCPSFGPSRGVELWAVTQERKLQPGKPTKRLLSNVSAAWWQSVKEDNKTQLGKCIPLNVFQFDSTHLGFMVGCKV